MKYILYVTIVILILPITRALADKPVYVEVEREFLAPAHAIWEIITAKCAPTRWVPNIVGCTSYLNKKRELTRDLNFGDFCLTESETERSPSKMTIRYYAIDHPLEFSEYDASVSVKPMSDSRSVMVWKSEFQSRTPEAAHKLVEQFYQGGLECLATIVEQNTECKKPTDIKCS